MTKLTWDNSYFISMMYNGLKDEVKDKLARDRNLLIKFTEWAELVIDIDDKQYARCMEKKRGGR